ncbi:MAG: DNA mismatch repair endonuclease MutL [Bacteroidaceae bacterium]
MGDIIHLLPDVVANQIAAGEVIQRPSSVLKELIENAIDAKAKSIKIFIIDAGKTSIQVLDDGLGMSETDARLAFERHATSKIKKTADLYALNTMGFRGEALASIAAVAQVELTSRTEQDELGVHLSLSGSKITEQELVASPVGSKFVVNNLFFNIPARRRFLKSNTTELNNIMMEFERVALANATISFAIFHNNTDVLTLPAGNFKKRIMDTFGKKYNQILLPIQVETSIVKISGYISMPNSSKKKGNHQFFFVNGRFMRHPYFHRALMTAYDQLIPVGEQVSYFVCFNVDPAKIDVNIHPTKTEIKFEDENAIWQILSAAAKETLGKYNAVPTIDFNDEERIDIPVFSQTRNVHIDTPPTAISSNYNPFNAATDYASHVSKDVLPTDWHQNGDVATIFNQQQRSSVEVQRDVQSPIYTEEENGVTVHADATSLNAYQYKGCYILTAIKSGLLIIHQHRAHIRVLYDTFMSQLIHHNGVSQRLLFPEIVQIPPSRTAIMNSLISDLQSIGFDFSDLGGGGYAINAQPVGTEGLNLPTLLMNIVDDAIDGVYKIKEDVFKHIALTMAKKAAIVPGQVLGKEEMEHLIDNLFSCKSPNYTPDGNLVLTIVAQERLDFLFK